ncbi:MAG: glycoside hydrolase family 18 protein [Ignavibacteria bacterium]|nr:glycoside hydrolase family 18 protein [Ignavibacteria bacterium]
MKNNWILMFGMILCFSPIAEGQNKEIIGYFPSWKWRSRDALAVPSKIRYDKLTMLNYAFFYPLKDGTLASRDSVGDEMFLRGKRGPVQPEACATIVDRAHQHGVKVLLSIGGWADSGNFPEVAASDATRARFAQSCLEQIAQYGFDGIDLDWEFPGYAEHGGTTDDRGNFTRLLQTCRDSLEVYGKRIGKRLLLTAALPAGAATLEHYEMDNVARLLDMLNVMTYDYSGTWDSLSGHNAPLYAPTQEDSSRNFDASFRLYTINFKIPPSKINLGIPFYGHAFADCSSIYGNHTGADTVIFSAHGCFYYDVLNLMDRFDRHWDERAKVPYLVSRSGNVLVTYDDEESIRHKVQYVIDRGALGVIIWEITGDNLADGRTPLLDVIHSILTTIE